MSRILNRSESFERAYEAFAQINFNAFDFNTVKQSLIDYLKLYFPEEFNNFIESDELIAMLELFAYISELVAYRLDINAHESLLTQAQRKDSILRLAKLLSYSATRNIANRGLVKITSITTTETIFDSNGTNLAGVRINWNDQNNPNWKEQFLLIINKILRQQFGSVAASERVQVQDVLFELYQLNNNPLANGVLPFTASVSGENVSMELIPSTLNENGPLERRPSNASTFSLLFGQDGLGDGSDTTGFLIFTKQGTLAKDTATFDGVTPNQTFEVNVDDINDTDIFLNNIDPDTGATLDDGSVSGSVSGEWVEVDLANAQNIVFNTNIRRQKYEVETLDNDQIRLIFGDGEFADIPSGTFDIWFRTSENSDLVIPQNTIINVPSSFTYNDAANNVQTMSFTFSLIGSLQNGSASETLEHIRRVAPSVYFTQDRMVNNRDYNTFMLQDPTILKLRALNRTFAGDSKYIFWHDPSETYEHVKLFGCDAAVYLEDSETFTTFTSTNIDTIIDNFIEPLLSTTDFFTILSANGVPTGQLRKRFTVPERVALFAALNDIISGFSSSPLHIYYHPDIFEFEFQVGGGIAGAGSPPNVNPVTGNTFDPAQTLWTSIEGIVEVEFVVPDTWTVTSKRLRMVIESQETRFWNTNNGLTSIDYDTLNTVNDKITILQCNTNDNRTALLTVDQEFSVLNQQLTVDELKDIHRLNVLPADTNNDNIADGVDLADILNGLQTVSVLTATTFVDNQIFLFNDFDTGINTVVGNITGTTYVLGVDYTLENSGGTATSGEAATAINIVAFLGGDTAVNVNWIDYVYFTRPDTSSDWILTNPATETGVENWFAEVSGSTYPDNLDTGLQRRLLGRTGFNFAWFHSADRFRLIDPAQTNIIDTFIIPRGYFISILDYLNGQTTVEPTAPTSLDLKLAYGSLLDNKMISDTVILQPGLFKLIIGDKSLTELQAVLRVIRPTDGTLTDNQVKTQIVDVVNTFFDINLHEFGETFYVTELLSAIHNALRSEIDSVVLVPLFANHQFGDLFQILAREDEIIIADIGVEDIEVITNFTAVNLRQ